MTAPGRKRKTYDVVIDMTPTTFTSAKSAVMMCAGEADVVVAHGQACCVSSDGDSETGRRRRAQQAHAPRLLRRTQTSTERGFATAYGMFSIELTACPQMRLSDAEA